MARTDTASRVIDAPSETVFAALVDPTALVEWLPPAGMTGHFDHFDARTMTWTVTPVAGGMTSSLANLAAHLAARHSSPHRRGGGQPTR